MYPFINLGPIHLGTFGLLLWLAAVAATVVLQRNFLRHGVDADALNIVALVVVAGVIGAKTWHELQDLSELRGAMRAITAPGWHQPVNVLIAFLHWFQAGFAWFGGMIAGIAMLMYQGRIANFKAPLADKSLVRVGGIRMLDLASPAAALGYGVGRLGCLTSGDGDYGIKTTLPWGVHMRPDALVPTPNLVQPTPIYELLFSIVVAWLLWRLGRKAQPAGWLTGFYLILSGLGRFLVEFVRINPRLYWGMSNAQVAALVSALVGFVILSVASTRPLARTREFTTRSAGVI